MGRSRLQVEYLRSPVHDPIGFILDVVDLNIRLLTPPERHDSLAPNCQEPRCERARVRRGTDWLPHCRLHGDDECSAVRWMIAAHAVTLRRAWGLWESRNGRRRPYPLTRALWRSDNTDRSRSRS